MEVIEKNTKQKYILEVSPAIGKKKIKCPVCSEKRTNKKDKALSWNGNDKVGKCHYCEAIFYVESDKNDYVPKEAKEYKIPEWQNNTQLSDKAVKYFKSRGIEQFTLRQMKITEGLEWIPKDQKKVNTIQFNYFRDEQLVNTKYRSATKGFKLVAGAELIPYNLDNIKGKDTIYIVEGEFDALSLYECGIHNVVSVPAGASTGDCNFDWLDNSIDYFSQEKKIILAVDNDKAGINLRNQLSSRLGVERCFKVDFGTLKDANDVLRIKGKESLKKALTDVSAFPLEGVFTANDIRGEVMALYDIGLQKGKTVGVDRFDELISFEEGRIITVTGAPGSGKTEFIEWLTVRMNMRYGLKTAYFSPERLPMQYGASLIAEKIIGKSCELNAPNRMTRYELEVAVDYISDNFYFISPINDDYLVDNILEKARQTIFRHGVKALVIDPYNQFEHKRKSNKTEHEYIGEFMSKIGLFARRNNIMIFLIAHPVKMDKNADGNYHVPTLYNIAGSSNFFNKTDYGISMRRNTNNDMVEVYIQKVKFSHLGKLGRCNFWFTRENKRYTYAATEDREDSIFDNEPYLNYEGGEQQELRNGEEAFMDDPLGSYNGTNEF